MIPIRYDTILPERDVETYRRVKTDSMRLARTVRGILADMVGGSIGDAGRSRKEFLHTHVGLYRVSMGGNSDNTTERAAHERMGVKTLVVSSPQAMKTFFNDHGLNAERAYKTLYQRTRREFRGVS